MRVHYWLSISSSSSSSSSQLISSSSMSFAAVLSGVTTSFFRKGNLIVVEAESDGGVITCLSLKQKTIDSIKNVLEGSISGPVTVKDTVADTAVAGSSPASQGTARKRSLRTGSQGAVSYVRIHPTLIPSDITYAFNDDLPEKHVSLRNVTVIHRMRIGSHVAHLDKETRCSQSGKTGLWIGI
ncbi:hypothetical protein KCU91_g130, partial [Aureobasidium melanogenum]